jgi:hypothetical protein
MVAVIFSSAVRRLVQPQRNHECRLAPGRDPGAVLMSEDGLHGMRADRSRCAAGLVAGYEPAAVVIRPLRGSSHAKPAQLDQILPGSDSRVRCSRRARFLA